MTASPAIVTSLYDELGVSPDASPQELRDAYRREARRLHPDARIDDPPDAESEDRLRRLNAAWHVLGDERRRRAYDESDGGWAHGDGDEADSPWEWDEHRAYRRGPRVPWWIVAVAIMVLIFVFTAYAAAPGGAPSGN